MENKESTMVEPLTGFETYLEERYYNTIAKYIAQIISTRRQIVWNMKEEKLCKGEPYNPLRYGTLRDFLSEIDHIQDNAGVMFRDTLGIQALVELKRKKDLLCGADNRTEQEVIEHKLQKFDTWIKAKEKIAPNDLAHESFWKMYEKGCKEIGSKIKDTQMLDEQSDKDTVEAIYTAYMECFNRNPMPQHKVQPFKVAGIREELKDTILQQLDYNVYIEGLGLNTYLKKSKSIIHSYLRYVKYLHAHKELKTTLETPEIIRLCHKLIERVALIEGYQYTMYCQNRDNLPTAEQVLTYNKCRIDAFMFDMIYAYRKSYVDEHTRQAIIKKLPKKPKNLYPKARMMHRHFIINYGDTNTGKTYHALEALKEAQCGTYLAPLRLLALEVQEKLLDADVVCDLRTGEEELLHANATHSSCTVEKANLNIRYDVAVVDECQLVDEVQRGWAWSRAILGLQANVIYLCVAREGVDILKEMITDCGDTFELREYTRETALQIENKDFIFPVDVKKADAIVCFSKNQVLSLAAELSDLGIKTSVLYGALPYATRKKQLERFVKGETEVVVCTDCIGMGINVAILRVVLMSTSKFDGIEKRELTASEIKQIAGRAGRRNMYKYGYVTGQSHRKQIATAIKSVIPQIETARLGFEDDLVNIDANILDILRVWQSLPDQSIYIKTNIDRNIELIDTLLQLKIDLEKSQLLALSNIPFDERIQDVFELWKVYAKKYAQGCRELDKPALNGGQNPKLDSLEVYYKCLDMYYAFSKNFQLPFDHVWLAEEKERIADQINTLLLENMGQSRRKCKNCGKVLPWDFIYTICDDCYYNLHFNKE